MGIVIVLNLFFNYTISLFYKEPNYNDYVTVQIMPVNPPDKSAEQVRQDKFQEEQKVYDNARNIYNRNVFIVLVVLGVISLALGMFLANEILVLGLSWGGVLSLVIASIRYWSQADNLVRVLILGFALAVLIWLAVRKSK